MATPFRLDDLEAVIIDLDGTLVDSVYQHVSAWRSAFLEVGLDIPGWVLHRAVGMGGDRFVAHVAGQAAEQGVGDEVRALHDRHFEELLPQVTALEGADELLDAVRELGLTLLLASSGTEEMTDRLLDLVERRDLLHAHVSGDEVELSKPSPDLLDAAMDRAGTRNALVIGDTVWDIEASRARALPCVALLTGGISEDTLRGAGAVDVHPGPAELAAALRSERRSSPA